jgi:hypothetical protein
VINDTIAVLIREVFAKPAKKAVPVILGPGLHRDIAVADCLEMSVRAIRERALAHGIRRRPLFLTEAEVLQIMEPVPCSSSPKDMARPTGRRAERTSASRLKEALALATSGKPKPSSPNSKTKSSKATSMVLPFRSPRSLKRP